MLLAPVLGRVAGLLVMMILAWQVLARGLDFNAASGALRFIHGVDLVIHEAGHTFAFFLPRFLYILAGSALQVILPAICAVTFLRQGQSASFAVALFWTGESITAVAIYMADAKKQALPLLGGEGVTHDWNYLLAQLHLLGAADFLGRLTWLLGLGLILTAIAILANETWRAWQRAAPAYCRVPATRRVDAEGVPPEQYKSYRRVRESLLALSDEKALEQAAICGDAEEVTDKIPQHQEALGVNYLMGSFNRGGVPHEQIMRSMRLFEEKVLPRLA